MSLTDHLEKLRHFSGVVRSGSIRSYALAHRLSQPAISKAIQILESELETALLVRSRDGVSLTPAGDELLKLSETILASSKAAEDRIRAHGSIRLEGRFVLGTYQSIAVYFLPRLLKHLSQVQKHIHLEFKTAPSAALVQLLKSGSIDFIISIDPPKRPGMVHQLLFEDTYSLYSHVASSHESGQARIFTLPTATDSSGKTLGFYLEKAGLLRRIVGCGDFEAVKAMVESDVGWGLMPDNVAAPLLSAGKIKVVTSVPRLHKIGPHRVVFSCLKHRQADQSIRWIGEQIHLMLRSEN